MKQNPAYLLFLLEKHHLLATPSLQGLGRLFGLMSGKMQTKKQYIFCPDCQTKHTLEFWMKSWAGFKCEKCGNYIVIGEQLHFTEKLEAQNV